MANQFTTVEARINLITAFASYQRISGQFSNYFDAAVTAPMLLNALRSRPQGFAVSVG